MATKKPRGKQYWYRHKRKRIAKKPKASLLSLPAEVRFLIYGYVFVNQRMIDVATTEKGDYRRRYGGQSLLFVNKIIRKEASHAFYKTCIFEVPHFRLHKEHIGLNPMKNLDNIQNLYILWTVPNHAKFTSKTADDQMLEGLKNLKKLTLDLRGLQYILVDSGADEADLHSSLMEKFRPHFHNLPTWMKRLIRNHSERLTIYLVVHFFAAPIAAPTFFARATILWRDSNVVTVEPADKNEWSKSRKVTKEKLLPISGINGEITYGRRAGENAPF